MNIYKFSTALLATIIATACSEMITPEVPEGAGQITVTAKVGVDVKAGYDSKTLPDKFFMSINQGSDESFNYDLTMTKAEDNIYRANRDQLKWASSNHGNVLVNAITLPSVSGESAQINLTEEQDTEDQLNANDILGAKSGSGVTISGDNIDISFKHLMSKLHVVYESVDEINNITVTSIKLKNVSMGGNYSFVNMSSISSNSVSADADGIDMYLNAGVQYGIKAAEAIFYPYKPDESVKPSLIVTASVNEKPMSSDPIAFAQTVDEFKGGKRYMIKVEVKKDQNRDKLIVDVKSLSTNDWVKNVPGGKILWVGTSIPAGAGTNNYPQMIANATGLQIVNNAVGGSVLMKDPNRKAWIENNTTKESWDKAAHYLQFGGLIQSHDYIDSYYGDLLKAKNNDENWINKHLDGLKALSYQSLVEPYINGTLDNCQTIVIDHGFNDLSRILPEAGAFTGWDTTPSTQYGDVYFDGLINEKSLIEIGVPDYSQYKAHLKQFFWDIETPVLNEEYSYLIAMESLIDACRSINPEINIILGNYFTEDNLWINYYYGLVTDVDMSRKYARTLCYYNKAAAKLFNCRGIVNFDDVLGIANDDLWSGMFEYKPDGSVGPVVNNSKFCPDGIHPSSDGTGNSNRQIADIYLQELAKIFKTTTKSAGEQSHPATDNSWEDVELL